MNEPQDGIACSACWDDALLAAALFAVDPAGAAGIVLRCRAGPARDLWLQALRGLLPDPTPLRRIPINIADSRLLGGLDLTASLRAGKPVADRGVLVESNGGVVYLSMTERMSAAVAGRIANVLDTGIVAMERDGLTLRSDVRLGIVALDEGIEENERCPDALSDRLAFLVDLSGDLTVASGPPAYDACAVAAARRLLPKVALGDEALHALCVGASALGVASLRAPLLAVRAARASAALRGRNEVVEEDVVVAARLVLAPRAMALPSSEREAPDASPPEAPQAEESEGAKQESFQDDDREIHADASLDEIVLEAAAAAIPAGLLTQLQLAGEAAIRTKATGKSGALKGSGLRGRPAGARCGKPGGAVRLNLVETLRAAAPWQKMRRMDGGREIETTTARRIIIRPEDFRVTRYKQRTETLTIFAVDASGSSALNRLAEAKGAVELLLADCYVRRDQVAVLAFRGAGPTLLLAPTRSLARAKRSLAGLPGGGGTPLAGGIDAALKLAEDARRKGQTPIIVLLTDGAANIARDGRPGRAKAQDDALGSARFARSRGFTMLLVDTAPRPQPFAQRLAADMKARYLALPSADPVVLSGAVRSAAAR
ncbi:magnesium chelatase subunit D [Methylocapsa palsarum]|uniref:Magnesium chelatase subunit D n=1 Tax=Methylocapsa palsarum TaxID=1612308 RepID=A0A1I4BAU6_9HYPH|nr:magnesium chelatase subunit D [Methylocapsa palsarum]SFK65932.1 magnesium chelatase subunit D [Methylocapsa palsarum]